MLQWYSLNYFYQNLAWIILLPFVVPQLSFLNEDALLSIWTPPMCSAGQFTSNRQAFKATKEKSTYRHPSTTSTALQALYTTQQWLGSRVSLTWTSNSVRWKQDEQKDQHQIMAWHLWIMLLFKNHQPEQPRDIFGCQWNGGMVPHARTSLSNR